MTTPSAGFGPNPWQQTQWDWRAAGNFICGGAGGGLIVFTGFSGLDGLAAALLMLAGMGLVGLGLLCVWLEIGRPLRALNVFINARSSWMSREAMVSLPLFALGLGAALGVWPLAPLAALTAVVFIYCQARIVQAAKGIPAWREPLTVPLLMASGLAEGAGLFCLATAWWNPADALIALPFAGLLATRWLLWRQWRARLAASAAPRALAAIDHAGWSLQWLGGVAPLVLIALAASGLAGEAIGALLWAAAGLLAAAPGVFFKFVLITRAAFNQGFRLTRLPVRGVPR
ncbi:MAG TPA: DmsC/YnfH family molybdoenzyme membrane anchor subunit [Albitalea sp.]